MARQPDQTRRRFLIGAGGVIVAAAAATLGVAEGLLPGRDTLDQVLGVLPSGVPATKPGPAESGEFASAARHGATTGWTISHPPGPIRPGRAVLVVLHGRGADHRDAFGASLNLDRFQAQLIADGAPPFAIASVDGGDHGYWHPRTDGDPAAMVLTEFVPLLARHGLDTSRLGFLGWSMGGYGSLYLAGLVGAARCRAVVAESPAVWHTAGETAAGAFDSAQDFAEHGIFTRLTALRGIDLRIDCGASDGFAPVTRDLRAALNPTPAGGIEPGAHDADYWRSQAHAQLAWVAAHLSA